MPATATRFAMAIDPQRCINCKACAVACRAEHGTPVPLQRNWVRENLRGAWPKISAEYEPGQCHHCASAPCITACPTGASKARPDGIVVVNEAECVGCEKCVDACPYGARFLRADRDVIEKCDLCAARLDAGRPPACLETCPGKVRIVGDAGDPAGRFAKLLSTRAHKVKLPNSGTRPQTFYFL